MKHRRRFVDYVVNQGAKQPPYQVIIFTYLFEDEIARLREAGITPQGIVKTFGVCSDAANVSAIDPPTALQRLSHTSTSRPKTMRMITEAR